MALLTRRQHARRDGLVAGAVGGVVGGIPSTVWALLRGGDPLEATLAAGSIVLPRENRRGRLAAAAVPVHAALSLGWGIALARTLPRRPSPWLGVAAGLGIGVLDLALGRRLFPRIRALALLPQLADHAGFGAAVASVLARRP